MSLPGIQALPSLQLFLSLAPLLNLGMQGSPQLYPCTPSLSTGTHLVTLPCSWLSMPSVCPRPQVHPELSESSPGCRPEHSAALLTSPWDTPWACPPQQGRGPALSSPSRQPSSPQETGSGLKLLRPEPGLLPDAARSLPCPHWLTRPFFYLQVATSLLASGLWFKVTLLVSPCWPPCSHTIVPSSLDNSGTLVSFPCSLLFDRLCGFKKGSTNSSLLLPSSGRRGNSCSAPKRGRTVQLTLANRSEGVRPRDQGAKGPGLNPTLSLLEGVPRRVRPYGKATRQGPGPVPSSQVNLKACHPALGGLPVSVPSGGPEPGPPATMHRHCGL